MSGCLCLSACRVFCYDRMPWVPCVPCQSARQSLSICLAVYPPTIYPSVSQLVSQPVRGLSGMPIRCPGACFCASVPCPSVRPPCLSRCQFLGHVCKRPKVISIGHMNSYPWGEMQPLPPSSCNQVVTDACFETRSSLTGTHSRVINRVRVPLSPWVHIGNL